MSYFDENGIEKWVGGSSNFTWKDTYNLGMIYIAIQANTTYNNTLVKPQIEIGKTPSEYSRPLAIGDVVSLRLDWNHMDVGAISAIEGNSVTIELNDGE